MSVAPAQLSTQVLRAVGEIIPLLQAATPAIDRDRQLPPAVIAALRAAGVYRMLVPVELGGGQVDLQTLLGVIELVAQGNGAAGWDLATSSAGTFIALMLPPEGQSRIFGQGPDVCIAGAAGPTGGRAVAVAGGYQVSGQWRFGSGCAEADWMGGGCQVFDDDMPRRNAAGQPEFRLTFFPRAAVKVHDTWQVVGLRGTGSHDWSVDGVFVPDALTQVVGAPHPWPGTLYRIPTLVLGAVHFSAVATGIARRALDSLQELAQTKTPLGSRGLLRERVQVQEAVARAEVLLESARAYRTAVVAEVWATAARGEPLTMAQRARMRLAGTNATECAVRAVDLMFGAGGTTSIEDESPLSHCFRDVHTVAQNINVLPLYYEYAGRVLLGMEPGTPLI